LTNGCIALIGNKEGLPLTRFRGLRITINLGFKFGLVPVFCRGSCRFPSLDLKLTSKLFSNLGNNIISCSSLITECECFTSV
jgi:hypothetical protein